MRFTARCVSFLIVTGLAGSASALLVDFETASGYTAGSRLSGQPSSGTRWTSDSATLPVWIVTASGGVDGGQAIQLHPDRSLTDYKSDRLTPVAGDIPDFNPADCRGVLKVEFMIRNDAYLAGSTVSIGLDLARGNGGNSRSARLSVRRNGTLVCIGSKIGGGDQSYSGKLTDNHFHKLSMRQDFDAQTFDVYCDDVLLGEGLPFADRDPTYTGGTLGFFGLSEVAGSVAAQFTIDNLRIEGVPPPPAGTVVLLR